MSDWTDDLDIKLELYECEIFVNGQTEAAFLLRGREPLKKPAFFDAAAETTHHAENMCERGIRKLGFADPVELVKASVAEAQVSEARHAGAVKFQVNTFLDAAPEELEYIVGRDRYYVDRLEFNIACELATKDR